MGVEEWDEKTDDRTDHSTNQNPDADVFTYLILVPIRIIFEGFKVVPPVAAPNITANQSAKYQHRKEKMKIHRLTIPRFQVY